jgi:hypothetical protein
MIYITRELEKLMCHDITRRIKKSNYWVIRLLKTKHYMVMMVFFKILITVAAWKFRGLFNIYIQAWTMAQDSNNLHLRLDISLAEMHTVFRPLFNPCSWKWLYWWLGVIRSGFNIFMICSYKNWNNLQWNTRLNQFTCEASRTLIVYCMVLFF